MSFNIEIVYALLGVGISAGLGAAGSSIGVGAVAKSGAGLLSKEPEKFPLVLSLAALPSTQALYGLLFAFIVLSQTGLLAGKALDLPANIGIAYMLASLPVGIACLFSGIYQGQAAASSVKILATKPDKLSQGIVLASILESFAIFGLVVSLLIVFVGIKF